MSDHTVHCEQHHGHHHHMMTFGSWYDYKLVLVFDWWEIAHWHHFALSWLMIVVLVVGLHWLKAQLRAIEEAWQRSVSGNTIGSLSSSYSSGSGGCSRWIPSHPTAMRLLHAVTGGGTYAVSTSPKTPTAEADAHYMIRRDDGVNRSLRCCLCGLLLVLCLREEQLSLFLMLVSMTFNPMLFLALVVGYVAGDFIFGDAGAGGFSAGDCH